jgi:hypothetical protein
LNGGQAVKQGLSVAEDRPVFMIVVRFSLEINENLPKLIHFSAHN